MQCQGKRKPAHEKTTTLHYSPRPFPQLLRSVVLRDLLQDLHNDAQVGVWKDKDLLRVRNLPQIATSDMSPWKESRMVVNAVAEESERGSRV